MKFSNGKSFGEKSSTERCKKMSKSNGMRIANVIYSIHQKLHLLIDRFAKNDYRERSMPESPTEIKPPSLSSNSMSPVNSLPAPSANMQRPQSASSTTSGQLNGSHSPQSTVSGRTPSPPVLGSSNSAQQLPPACGARQLSKLKRFLTTLIQFGTDISPEIGERVRSLVRALVNNHLSIEEFHSKLQEATNFPLRPFVIPFLKTNLPLLQRELLHCARMARQTPQQYLAHNEHVIFDPSRPPMENHDVPSAELNENGKRVRSPERMKENGMDLEGLHPAKRPHSLSPGSMTPRVSPGSGSGSYTGVGSRSSPDSGLHRLERDRFDRERGVDRDRHLSPYNYPRGEHYDSHFERIEDEWKHLENMLHCVMDMVGRCRQALTTLQERTRREREDLARWVRQHNGVDPEVKKRADYMTESLRHTEDRVSEVRRRAVHVFPEDAVNEVKRQAMIELQKAVAAAEAKATELVTAERAKMEHAITEARKQVRDELMGQLNRQEESTENCWNCGRQASETCSGCNIARYCGSFCQHKDWETHHRVCSLNKENTKDSETRAESPVNQPQPILTPTIASAAAPTVKSSSPVTSSPVNSPTQQEKSPSDNNKNNVAAVPVVPSSVKAVAV